MFPRQSNSSFHSILFSCFKPAFLLAAVFVEIDSARAVDFSIGGAETVYTKSQRKSGGSSWPDGSFGVLANGDGTYDFYGANSSKSVLTTGTLADPAASKKSVKITGVPKGFSYLAGGPVFEDPYSGARLMVYHAEDGGKGKSFYSVLGMAISTDATGQTFQDLGVIIRPQLPAGLAEIGGGSFAIVDGHMNVYFKDWYANGWTNEVAVARAPMAELMTNALMGRPTEFKKYHNGEWNQPGLGGYSSHLEPSNAANSWLGVSYNTYLDQVVMVSSQWSGDGGDLYMATSSDGVNFGPRIPIAVDPGEQFYPSIVGIGDPQRTGQSFYVYYTDSKKGAWGRWGDAQLRRRQITITSPGNNPLVSEPNDSLGYTAEWVAVSDYQSDFQTGAPADGWKYVWNPKGKVGKSADYAALHWSESAQAYNTTGGATMVPNPKTHADDYLSLAGWGGHPGNKKYMPMAGYTIQADDGAGLYRLIDSSIQKTNGTLLSKEDGLNVLVYVNDTLIGSPQGVSTNGLFASFDRMLGPLNIGDTVWVMIDPLKTQLDDAFYNFDFSLQRLVYSSTQNFMATSRMMQTMSVPEPSTAILLLTALAMYRPRRRARGIANRG